MVLPLKYDVVFWLRKLRMIRQIELSERIPVASFLILAALILFTAVFRKNSIRPVLGRLHHEYRVEKAAA
jgi:hypothetical protein